MDILEEYGKVLPHFFVDEPIVKMLAIGVGSIAVQLEDGTVGLSFTLNDPPLATQGSTQVPSFPLAGKIRGSGAYTLLSFVESDSLFLRCIGLATINALSQSIFQRGVYKTTPTKDVTDLIGIQNEEHVVMMGAVKPMLKDLVKKAGKLYVYEKGDVTNFKTEGVTYGTDVKQVESANILLIASRATLLLDRKLKEVLLKAKKAREIVVMGPNYCMIPDVLFDRGVTRIGARRLIDNEKAVQIVMEGGKRDGFDHIAEYYAISRG